MSNIFCKKKFVTLKKSIYGKFLIIGIAIAILIIVFFASVSYGAANYNWSQIWDSITGKNPSIVINTIRISRIIIGILVGINLSISGVLLQSIMKNPLASPNIIGVNSGAGFAAIVIMAIFPLHIELIPIAAFIGALVTALFVFLLSLKKTPYNTSIFIVLAGVAISSLLKALTSAFMTLNSDILEVSYSWLLGSLSGRTWDSCKLILPWTITGVICAFFISPKLNLFALGDKMATNVGLKLNLYRFVVILISAILAGSAVSVAGTIGFVGLIAPHISRILIGNDHKFLVPMSAIVGAILMIISDLAARMLFNPIELEVGIVTAILGAPFFVLLLLYKKRKIKI